MAERQKANLMQTFLPYPDLTLSAMCLDPMRLGNQVYRECKTLIQGGWANHPAAKMWKGFESGLALYSLECLKELRRRGKPYPHHEKFFRAFVVDDRLPNWFGDDRLHSSHRAALLYKRFEWYGKFGWAESPAVPDAKGSLPYYWPVR